MTRDEIREIVIETIASTFDVEAAGLAETTVADEVEGWDSLGHTVLMIRLRKRLGDAVTESIASEAKDVGNLIALLGDRLAAS